MNYEVLVEDEHARLRELLDSTGLKFEEQTLAQMEQMQGVADKVLASWRFVTLDGQTGVDIALLADYKATYEALAALLQRYIPDSEWNLPAFSHNRRAVYLVQNWGSSTDLDAIFQALTVAGALGMRDMVITTN